MKEVKPDNTVVCVPADAILEGENERERELRKWAVAV